MDHYTHYSTFLSAFVGFNQFARKEGFKSGLQCSLDTISVALLELWTDKELFEYALTSLFCNVEKERKPFSGVYKRFWLEKGSRLRSNIEYKNQKNNIKKPKSALVITGTGRSREDSEMEESRNTSGANSTNTLKSTDFSKLNPEQSELLDEVADELIRELSLRIKRRRKKSKNGQVDIGKSIRKNIQNGGNIIHLLKTKHKKDKFRLLVLLDVSGSMDKYSYYLLKFLWSLKVHFEQVEVFAFSTILTRITEDLSDLDIKKALSQVSQNTTQWSSGTKIGECFEEFNEIYARQYLKSRTLTIVLSDGLDTGEEQVLESAFNKIKQKSSKLVWLNPLKAMDGYEPIQKGMKTVYPELNYFGAAHNFNSLMELENILINA